MFGIFFALVVMGGSILLLRSVATRRKPFLVVIAPANTHGLVITKPNTVSKATDGTTRVNNDGGNVTRVIHAIPGRQLNSSSEDPMDWFYEKGKEPRGLLFRLFGIQFVGIFRYLRINDVRTFRFGRPDTGTEYKVMPKSMHTRFPFFSGQHDVEMKSVETKEIIAFNLRFNFTLEEKFPVRVRLRTADPYAIFTQIVEDHVNTIMGVTDPKVFISGGDAAHAATDSLRRKLVESFKDAAIRSRIETETGLEVREAHLPELGYDQATQKLLEAATEAKMKGEANVLAAQKEAEVDRVRAAGKRDAQKMINEADAHRVRRVYAQIARDELRVRVRNAEAYENNETVTTFAPGKDSFVNVGK